MFSKLRASIFTALPQSRWRKMGLFLLLLVLAGATYLGIGYRHWFFELSKSGRYAVDIRRNYNFGSAVLDKGFLNTYEDQIRDKPSVDKKLDYPPLRLATFAAWAAWTRWQNPQANTWQPDYAFNSFLMRHNTALEWLASLAALLIVQYWVRESPRPHLPLDATPPDRWKGFFPGTLAFLLLWFDPGVLFIGHGWPSPNMWAIPYYLWTVYCCLRNRWFIAGLIMGIGAMLQGQQLFIVVVFVLWPIFACRPQLAFRWISGFALAFALVCSGWMLTTRPDLNQPLRQINWMAVSWILASLMGLSLLALRPQLKHRASAGWFGLLTLATLLVLCWPAFRAGHGAWVACVSVLLVGLVCFTNWSCKRYLLPLTLALSLFACIPLFNASTAWWKIGFLYGAERFPVMTPGPTNNLPAILNHYFGWQSINDIVIAIPQGTFGPWPEQFTSINMKQFLFTLFVIMLVVSALAMARQWRRKDRNLLVALVLPWVLFYTLLPQISPRYAVFIAGIGVLCIGRSLVHWLPVLFFTWLTFVQTGMMMIRSNRDPSLENWLFNGQVQQFISRFFPGPSWAEIVLAGIFLWWSFGRSTTSAPSSLQTTAAAAPAQTKVP